MLYSRRNPLSHNAARRAFTLVELLVVIAIIGLLSTVAVVALGGSQMNARNAKRKADLVQISKALELYYADNGAYPSTGSSTNYIGECVSYGSYSASGAGAWIPNLAPTYMAVLPRDPKMNIANVGSANIWCRTHPAAHCYIYTSTGQDYKVAMTCTPEGTLSPNDPFAEYGPEAAPVFQNHMWQISSPGARNW